MVDTCQCPCCRYDRSWFEILDKNIRKVLELIFIHIVFLKQVLDLNYGYQNLVVSTIQLYPSINMVIQMSQSRLDSSLSTFLMKTVTQSVDLIKTVRKQQLKSNTKHLFIQGLTEQIRKIYFSTVFTERSFQHRMMRDSKGWTSIKFYKQMFLPL